MKIAVNTRLLIKNKLDGIGWFSYETLIRICREHPEHEFIFLFDRKFDPSFIFSGNITPVVLWPPTRHPLLWFIWFEFSIPRMLKQLKADVFLSPDGYIPLRTDIPSIAIIHDINFYHRPRDLPFSSRVYYNFFFPRFASRARAIGTVSAYSKRDIQTAYGIAANKIEVLYNGVNSEYFPLEKLEKEDIRKELTGGVPYFIFVGSMHPRKNIPGLLRSFDLFRDHYNTDFRLIIVGEKMFMTKEIEQVYSMMKYRDDVIFTGRLGPEHLHKTLATATAMVFIPFFEGFGIPVLEAMRCGVPVIASNTTSIPEVAGDAALLYSPHDISGIVRGMELFAKDEALREEFIQKGLVRANKFSWEKTAERLWVLIEKTMSDA